MNWIKIRNRQYSQWVRHEGTIRKERVGDPDFRGWDDCVRACAGALADNSSNVKATVLGTSGGRALADRLASDESG
jgi:hypothetical protein